jgi:thioredoxin 1
MTIRELPGEEFDAALTSVKPVLMYFWATWCQPCKMMKPIMEQLAEENTDKMLFFKLDADANPDIVQKFGVNSIPTMLVFQDGVVVHSIKGAKPKPGMLKELAEFL